MPLPPAAWIIGGIALIVLLGILYEYALHPAWRKERRVVRACEEAFKEGQYRLTRLRTTPENPSVLDIVPRPFGLPDVPHYFTYNIETVEDEEPDFSGMSRQDIRLVRRYLRRSPGALVHHGKEVLRPEEVTCPSVPEGRSTEESASEE